MKITLGSDTLAAGDREAAANFRISHQRAVQAAQLIGSDFAAFYGRGNQQNTIRFEVSRVHADLETAMEFVLDHPGSLPDSGLLKIETNAGTGDRWIADAVLVSCELVAYAGTATVHAYTIAGGEVLTTDPTPP